MKKLSILILLKSLWAIKISTSIGLTISYNNIFSNESFIVVKILLFSIKLTGSEKLIIALPLL